MHSVSQVPTENSYSPRSNSCEKPDRICTLQPAREMLKKIGELRKVIFPEEHKNLPILRRSKKPCSKQIP